MPFIWNPSGNICGHVYKDNDGDGQKDSDENGLEGIIITVGEKRVKTNQRGDYCAKVTGKRVDVDIDFESIPDGYVFSTPVYQQVTVIPHKAQRVNFGLMTRSGLYGVVYFDENENGKLDASDKLISKVKIIVDEKMTVFSDSEGVYIVKSVSPGKHTITIDINSIPVEYLPLVKLKNEIEVQEGTTYIFHIPLKKK